MGLTCNGPRRLARLAMLALLAGGAPIAHLALTKAACAEPARPAVRSSAAARDKITLPRSRPAAVGTQDAESGDDADAPALPEGFRELARGSGEPRDRPDGGVLGPPPTCDEADWRCDARPG